MISRSEALPKLPDVSFGGFSVAQDFSKKFCSETAWRFRFANLARRSCPADMLRGGKPFFSFRTITRCFNCYLLCPNGRFLREVPCPRSSCLVEYVEHSCIERTTSWPTAGNLSLRVIELGFQTLQRLNALPRGFGTVVEDKATRGHSRVCL
jgi:hypothetical protein